VAVLEGYAISSESGTGGELSASGPSGQNNALYGALTFTGSSQVSDYFINYGSGTVGQVEDFGFPIGSGEGEVIAFELSASRSVSISSWDGSPMTFTNKEVFVSDQPSSLLLLLIVLMSLGGFALLNHRSAS
jgi:hypothetical protein